MIRIILLCLVFSSVSASNEYYGDTDRGWYWGEAEVEEGVGPSKKKELIKAPELSPQQILKEQGKRLEELKSTAVLFPTQENIKAYLAYNQMIMQQAQVFATNYKRTLWREPELDYTVERPVSKGGILSKADHDVAVSNERLNTIAHVKGLLYFFRSDCPYCARYAPILKNFANQHGFTIIPVSMDGKGTKEFPHPRTSYTLKDKLNVRTVPATFLVDPRENKVAGVGFGVLDYTKLAQRVIVAGNEIDGKDFLLEGKYKK